MANLVQAVKKQLALVGYNASVPLAAQVALLLATAERVRCMLLDGPPGAGKTSLAKAVARLLKVEVLYMATTAGTSEEDIRQKPNIVRVLRGISGDREAVKSGADVIKLGFLPRIFKLSQTQKVVAFVDELDKGSEDVDNCFLTALEEGEVLVDDMGAVKANLENLVLFFTKNNKREVAEPLMRRCRREYLSWPSEELEVEIVTGKIHCQVPEKALDVPYEPIQAIPVPIATVLVKLANLLRAKEADLIKPPASQEVTQAAMDVVRLASWGCLELAGEVCFGWLAGYREDREILKKITTPAKLTEALTGAVKSSGQEVLRKEIPKADDKFVDLRGSG